jgi:hypothetical protein
MKKPSDPVRLLDDPATSPRLSEALRHARSTPDAASVERMTGALGLPVPLAPPPVVPPASGLVAGSGGSAVGFLGWGGAVTVGLGAAALAVTASRAPSAPPPPAADRVAPARVVSAAAPLPPAAFDAVPEVPPATPAPPVRRKRASEPESEPSAAPAPGFAEAPPAAPADAASRLREEALLVRNAERLLGSDPAAALRLTEERRQRFPGGALGQEAEVVAIDALLRLGRRDAAVRRARAFEASHKDSLYARRIHALVGNP